uniref:Bacterial CdiA-CT RNAse A domain-containing protein n=1 Tax=uncultured Planctomycetota bacterium TaxID=120965 RepID=H5SE78_9BACT|nr:hypothetical protein HGMM_F16E03C03 [uncultured Planctomycetota bacterium]
MPANHFTLEASPAVIKYEDEPIYGGEAYVRVSYDPNLAGSLTFSATDLPPGISYDPTTGEFSGAALRSAVPRGGSPVTYNATITVSDGDETESATVPFTILDNAFSVETPATQVSHPGETVFFAPTLSYTQGNFSGPLMFSYENLPTSLSFDSLYGTVSGTIDANLVTPESNIRDYTVVLTVTDPITGDQQQVSFQWRVETDPYPAYISRVEQANAIYISAVQQALNERDSAWHTAIANAQTQADAAYSKYLAAWQTAVASYNAAVQDADSVYEGVICQADAAYFHAEQQALEQLQQQLAQIGSDYDSRVQAIETDYQADILAADMAYSASIAPYQADRDQAYEYWQQHPDDWDAYESYVQAQNNLDNAIVQASQQREQAYATAAAWRDLRLQEARQVLESQQASAYATYDSALNSAGEVWAATVDTAYSTWRTVVDSAKTAYEEAEAQAWNSLTHQLDIINTRLEEARLSIEAEFTSALSEETILWYEREGAAWHGYLQSYAQLLETSWLGSRLTEPPAFYFEAGTTQPTSYLLLPVIRLDTHQEVSQTQEGVHLATDLLLPGDTTFLSNSSDGGNSPSAATAETHFDYYPLGMQLVVSAPPTEEQPSFWVRILGALEVVGGAGEMLAGGAMITAPDPSFLSKAGGGFLLFHGSDHIQAGWYAVMTGTYRKPVTVMALESAYGTFLSQESAQTAAQVTDIAISLYGLSKVPAGPPIALANLPRTSDLIIEEINPVTFRPVRVSPADPDYLTRFARRSSSGETPFDRFIRNPLDKIGRSFRLRVFGHADGLWYHERLGGHTIAKHVGKSPRELLRRLETEAHLEYASTFRSVEEAENYIALVLEAHADKIAAWLRQTGQQARKLELRLRFDQAVGQVLRRGSSELEDGHEVVVRLIRNPSETRLGFRIITAFVDP